MRVRVRVRVSVRVSVSVGVTVSVKVRVRVGVRVRVTCTLPGEITRSMAHAGSTHGTSARRPVTKAVRVRVS